MSVITETDKKYLLETWRRKLDVVGTVRTMTEAGQLHLAKVLENTQKSLRTESAIRNGVTQKNSLWFPDHVINMVSSLYASQVAEDLVSVQPLDSPLGRIVYLSYAYGDTRGDAVAGAEMISRHGAHMNGDYDTRYAAQLIEGEAVQMDSTTNTISAHLQNLPLLVDAEHPIIFRANSNSADRWKLQRIGDSRFSFKQIDANGYVLGAELLDEAEPVIVDPESGQIHCVLNTAISAAGLNAVYSQDLSSGPSFAGRVTLQLRTEQIKAEPHKLRAQYVFDAAYGLEKGYGIDLESSLVKACTSEIQHERDLEVINLLRRQAGSSIQWESTPSQYLSTREHNEGFLATIFAAASEIAYKTKKTFGNWCVVGKQGLDILRSVGAPRFVSTGQLNYAASSVVGMLDDCVKVIFSPFIARNEFLVGYKGETFIDAGFVLGDYLPIASTDWVMLDDFVGRAGFVSVYGTRMLNNKMYVRGSIV